MSKQVLLFSKKQGTQGSPLFGFFDFFPPLLIDVGLEGPFTCGPNYHSLSTKSQHLSIKKNYTNLKAKLTFTLKKSL